MGVKEKDAIPYLDTLLTKARQSQGVDQAYNEAKQLEAVKPLMQAFDAAITEGNLEGAAAIKENYPELAPYSAKLQEALYKGSEAVKAKQRTENEYADKRTLAALSIDNAQITNKANRRTNAKAESDDRVSSFLSSIISQNAAQEGSISPDFIEKTGKAAGLTSEERVKAVLLAQDANAKKTATLAGLQKAKIQSTYGDSLLGEGLYSDPAGREAVEKQIAALKLNPDEASNIRGTIGKLNKEYGQLPVRALLQALQASETGWIRDQEVADSFKTQFENLVGNARDIAPLLKQYNDDVKRLKSLTP
jgi:hypothetical protein